MADNSKIGWTDTTGNPLLGCERVSSGCDHCYAIQTATIRAGNPHPKVAAAFAGLTGRRDGRLDWTGRINLLPDRLDEPLHWRKPRRVFVNSQADLFHKDVPADFIAQVFAVMALAPHITFQLLTKRAARMRSLLNAGDFRTCVQRAALERGGDKAPWLVEPWWPLRNLHLGVSVEDQHWADIRVPLLLDTSAVVRWLSIEPLLGPVDLWCCGGVSAVGRDWNDDMGAPHPLVNWIVCGGESGSGHRAMELGWLTRVVDDCRNEGVPVYVKQDSGPRAGQQGRIPDDYWVHEFPREVAHV